jgi:flagellar biosynthesis chaperone FliJ
MELSEADAVLKDVEGILQQISRYHQLTEEQRLALHSRAGLARQKIGDVVRLLKSLNRAEIERQKPN